MIVSRRVCKDKIIVQTRRFIEASKNMERLQSEDVANTILYAIQAPSHVNVNEILLRPTTQER